MWAAEEQRRLAEGDAHALSALTLPALEALLSTSQQAMSRILSQLEERRQLERQCPVCWDAAKDTVLVPCGHQACGGCAALLEHCPTCRAVVTQCMRTFA